jgi:3-oxoadipate enol-lactonase
MQVFGDDGARVDVLVDGVGGDAVVMIAGFPVTREIWKAQSNRLSETHRVLRPDLRGMGASSVPDGPYLMETLASDVAAALDACAVERVALVGHSLGGYVALAFTRMFTERVSRLALVCSRLTADTPETAAARYATADRLERADDAAAHELAAYAERLLAPETRARRPEIVTRVRESIAQVDPRGAAAMLRGMALRVASDDIAADLGVPVLVVAGRCDGVLSIDEAERAAAAFPCGRMVVCERSGHLPMLEEADRVTDALGSFLSE